MTSGIIIWQVVTELWHNTFMKRCTLYTKNVVMGLLFIKKKIHSPVQTLYIDWFYSHAIWFDNYPEWKTYKNRYNKHRIKPFLAKSYQFYISVKNREIKFKFHGLFVYWNLTKMICWKLSQINCLECIHMAKFQH